MKKLDQLNFDNTFYRLPDIFYRRQDPAPLPGSYLVSFNESAAKLIDLDVAEVKRTDFTEYFIGNRLLPGSEPLSMLYAGHQFGYFVPQLGDGRAILLGEVKNSGGEYWDIQLKGAGVTPFSREGDGRAVLRSSIREYLCSEAMHALGIPTSRALCIVGSDAEVYRETIESAAVVTRLSPSHVRFGSFEVFAYRGQHEPIAVLADYVIAKHFPDIGNSPDKYLRFLNEVIARTANLVAKWQAVGFSHGVMNTDNMSILGLTIDYGPFGFMEAYDPGFICNHSDHGGRYAFDRQPQVALWNLACLAQSLTPIIEVEQAQEALENYEPKFFEQYYELMGNKLGLTRARKEDALLITQLLEMMRVSQLDYTNLFRSLGLFKVASDEKNSVLRDQFMDRSAFDAWADAYRIRLQSEPGTDEERKVRMDKVNPKYILRNSMAQTAIVLAQEERDFSEVDRLLALLGQPFEEQPEMEEYAAPAPEWARNVVVSCSS